METTKKQTVVDWLVQQFDLEMFDSLHLTKINQAKEMLREQIIESRVTSPMTSGDVMLDRAEAEHYYTETYE